MSASSPFRSHLLQQWTKGGRSPIGVATWLKKAIDDDTEEDNNPRPQKQNSNLYRSTLSSSKDSSQLTSIAAPAAATSWSTSVASDNNDDCNRKLKINHNITTINDYNNSDDDEGKNNLLLGSLKVDRNYSTRNLYSDAIHNMMIPRGGATAASKEAANDDERRRELLKTAIDRAVRVAQKKCSSQNHGEVVPFAFRRFFSNSQSSERLAEICSRNKIEEKWSNHNDNVQAFIVALVHNNQRATNDEELNDNDPFEAMEYSPPETEQNLEDYATTCAAVQNVIRSLHTDGFKTTMWATEPIIKTSAFRKLVKAESTDRIVALIMVNETMNTQAEEEKIRSTTRDLLIDLP